jgi:hypothetical protein
LLVSIPVHLFVLYVHSFSGEEFSLWNVIEQHALERLLQALVSPYVFVLAGAWVAPKARIYVAAALTVIWIIFAIGLFMYVSIDDEQTFLNRYEAIAAILLGIAGAIVGGFGVHEKVEQGSW